MAIIRWGFNTITKSASSTNATANLTSVACIVNLNHSESDLSHGGIVISISYYLVLSSDADLDSFGRKLYSMIRGNHLMKRSGLQPKSHYKTASYRILINNNNNRDTRGTQHTNGDEEELAQGLETVDEYTDYE